MRGSHLPCRQAGGMHGAAGKQGPSGEDLGAGPRLCRAQLWSCPSSARSWRGGQAACGLKPEPWQRAGKCQGSGSELVEELKQRGWHLVQSACIGKGG